MPHNWPLLSLLNKEGYKTGGNTDGLCSVDEFIHPCKQSVVYFRESMLLVFDGNSCLHLLFVFLIQFFKWANPGLFFIYFRVFKHTLQIFTTNTNVKKCPSTMRCRDSNSGPLEHELPPITTRPGLPPNKFFGLFSIFCFAIHMTNLTDK